MTDNVVKLKEVSKEGITIKRGLLYNNDFNNGFQKLMEAKLSNVKLIRSVITLQKEIQKNGMESDETKREVEKKLTVLKDGKPTISDEGKAEWDKFIKDFTSEDIVLEAKRIPFSKVGTVGLTTSEVMAMESLLDLF